MKREIIIIPNKDVLLKTIEHEIQLYGINCDLNHLDVSQVKTMSSLFNESKFNGNISGWDTSNVVDMMCMFLKSPFNGDISKWNVSNVKNMRGMFARSKFSGNLSEWDVRNVTNMSYMFRENESQIKDLDNWLAYKANIINMFNSESFSTKERPYWSYHIVIEERKKIIDAYHLSKSLEEKLSTKNGNIKRVKV